MDIIIQEQADKIGLSVSKLQKMLKRDDDFVNHLITLGQSREEAEQQSFLGDLRNMMSLMRSHNFSAHTAARLLRENPDNPQEISTTEDEEDGEEEEEDNRTRKLPSISSEESDVSSYPTSNSSGKDNKRSRTSSTSSSSCSEEDEAVSAKRKKMDPDYAPSTTPSEDTTSENCSQVTTEAEEELETETEEDSWVPSDSSEPEKSETDSSEAID
jgi:hypothetical protein